MMVSRRNSGLETALAPGVMRSVFSGWVLSLILSAGLLAPLLAQQVDVPKEVNVRGVIQALSAEGFTMKEYEGAERIIDLGSSTVVKEEKKSIFHLVIMYSPSDLIPGLDVHVVGLETSGRIQAETIRFTQDALKVARTITSRVEPRETPK